MKNLILTAFFILILAVVSMFFHPASEPKAMATPTLLSNQAESAVYAPVKLLGKEAVEKPTSEFEAKTDKFLEGFPTQKSIELQPGDFHHTPKEVMDASGAMAFAIDAMKADPALIPEGKAFFKKCSLRENIVEQVRAMCLRNLLDWAQSTDDKIDLTDYPSRIVRLANFLPAAKY